MTNAHAHRTTPAIALLACAALALAGCGGGSSSTSTTTSASSSVAAAAAGSSTSSASAASSATTPSAGSSTSGSASLNPAAQAYAVQLLPLAQAWQSAAQHYDNVVGGGGTNLALIASSSSAFAAATGRFADSIAALTPPAGAAGAQATLVAAIRALGRDVSELQSAATNRNPSAAADAQKHVGPDGTAVSNAVLALAKASQQG